MDIDIIHKGFTDAQMADDATVFDKRDRVVDEESIIKAQTRYEAIQAVAKGNATAEQRELLRDLDDAINQRGRYASDVSAPPVQPTLPAPVLIPQHPQAPSRVQPGHASQPPAGYRAPPQHSRTRR